MRTFMKHDKIQGIVYASIMIAAMLFMNISGNMNRIHPSGNFTASQKASAGSSQSSSRAANSNNTISAANNNSEQISSTDNSTENNARALISLESGKVEQASRKYYVVPLSDNLQDVIFSECDAKNVPADLVIALIDVESDFNPNLVSKTNDYGLMQINTCHKDSLKKALQITNLLDEKQNIKAGVYMLSGIVSKYSNMDQALMVYNCGEFGAKKLWNNGIYSTDYSRKVIAKINEIKSRV